MGGANPNAAGSVATIGAGSLLSAYSQYQSGQWNKTANDLMAQDALARGSYLQSLSRMRGSRTVAAGTAAAAGSNVDVQSGSVVGVAGGTRMMSALDSAILRHNALSEAYGYNVRGSLAEHEANNGATATLIGGAGQAYGAAYRSGMFNRSNSVSPPYFLAAPDPASSYEFMPTFARG